jgi:hypothetical protein
VLRSAAAAALAGALTPLEAQHVHEHAQAAKPKAGGPYKPKLFNASEYKSLTHLADMIIPPEGAVPGGAGAGAPEFIDLLCANNEELAAIFTGGLAWFQAAAKRHESHEQLLDLIAYRKNDSPELGPGIRFFDWVRRLVVDAWTTSPEGVKALGYLGNKGQTVYQVPRESLKYALSRSPFKD